jgi:histidine ammonia-lyase
MGAVNELNLTGCGLTAEDVVSVARDGRRVALAPDAVERMTAASEVAASMAAGDRPVYGLTTGVGALRGVRQSPQDAAQFTRLTVQAHRTSHGRRLPAEVGRAAMVHRVNALCRGRSMVRPQVAEAFVDALNDGAAPELPPIGSLGQSDLPATAELIDLLQRRGLVLRQGEALALLNGNSLTVGQGALALADTARLLDAYDVVGALTLEGFAGNISPLHPQVPDARPYPGLAASVGRMRALLQGSYLWVPGVQRSLQDPLSFRTIPQVLGAARDALGFARRQLETELNASGDNPMVSVSDADVVSVGNFDATPVAAALDLLRIALAQVITASCERVQKHLAGHFSGISTGLREADTPDDALALVGGGAAAIAAEARLLAMPVSLELPTSSIAGGIEDHLTMAPLGARRLAEMAQLTARLAAVELVVSAQAIDLRGAAPLGAGTAPAYARVRASVPFVGEGEAWDNDVEALAAWVAAGAPDA